MWKVAKLESFAIRGLVLLGFVVFLGIILLFLTTSGSEATTITVDDDGPAMYSKIQDAINASSNGYTVYIYNGTYYENIIVNKTINLTGEDQSITIIDGGGSGDVVRVVSDWVNVTGFYIRNSGSSTGNSGLRLEGVQNCNISYNNVSWNNEHGIFVNSSINNQITFNYLTYNTGWGVYLSYADYNIISNNTAVTNGDGIYIKYSTGNEIDFNMVGNHGGVGIDLYYSYYSSITYNALWDNAAGSITVGYSNNITVALNSLIDNIFTSTYGIGFWYSDENIIINNSHWKNGYGIYLSESDRNNVINNTVSGSTNCGISFHWSNENKIINNSGSNNNQGIELLDSQYNEIMDNIFILNGGPGFSGDNSHYTLITQNNFSESLSGMYFSFCGYNDIANNDLSFSFGNFPFEGNGIFMEDCFYNNVTNNLITSNNRYGIFLLFSYHNNITLNNISYNFLGMNLTYSSDNLIYHNNIINNTNQAYDDSNNDNFWDCGYPLGGNFWSDYTGSDIKRGPNQDQDGSDGIGDTPYEIDGDSLDNYPLMEPYEPPNGSNNPPIITTVDQKTAYEGVLYWIDYEAYDYEDDPLLWNLSTNASWLSIDNTTGVLSGTPISSDIGSYWVNVTVEDGIGGMDYHNFTLIVTEKPILNLDTLERFMSIQEAIDDLDTENSHTIWVKEGIYYENVVIYKTINLIGENKETTIVNCLWNGTTLLIIADWVNVTGLTFEGSSSGPEVAGVGIRSDYNNISGNIMTLNYKGIFLYSSANNNVINGNFITNNRHGIWVNSSSNNHIVRNEIYSNDWDGISLFSGCYNNNVTYNNIMGANYGIYIYYSYDNIVFHNNISFTDSMGIRILSADRNNISSNNVFSNYRSGIKLRYSDDNKIINNIIINNSHGLNFYSSHLNNIKNNNISSNTEFGIYLEGSTNNSIYHNNILNNINQSYDDQTNNNWDDGYPNGGNYWSDYTGVDNYSGSNQDILGSDGIGDEHYVIDVDSKDKYPLMLLWQDYINLDIIAPFTIHIYIDQWYTSTFTITLNATDDRSGVNETYYLINGGTIKRVSIDGYPYIEIEGDNNTLEYWSIDNTGNEESHKFIYKIKLDKTPPSTSDDYDSLWHYSDFTITLGAFDETSGIEEIYYRINDGQVQSVSFDGQPLISIESENNTMEYWSVDVAGNIEEHNFLYNIQLNKTYPDLTVTEEDIVFSKSRLIEGREVYINATIHNIGNLSCQAKIKFYDGEPQTGSLIGEIIVNVPNQNSAKASIKWLPSLGNHNIYVLIEESIPEEPYTNNNVANKSVTVEVPPVLVLSVGDMNIFRFESGEERTVPVYVSCYNNSANNVRLVVLDDRGLNITVVTPPQNLSKDENTVFYLRIKVPTLSEGQEFKEEDILLQIISDEASSNEESLDVIVGRSVADFFGWILMIGGAAAGAGVVGFIGGTEIGKYALFAAAMSLYTRLKREDILDQETRGMIRGYIMANPGEHYNAIKRALGLKNGTLAYHLKTLEKEKLIKSERDGRYKRFYPPGMKVPEEVVILNKAQELIMGQIIKNPGISQKELSNNVGLSTSTINYHISVMANAGFIRVERKGKHTMCYPEEEAS